MNKRNHFRNRSFHNKPVPKPKPGSFLSKNSTRNVNYRQVIVQLTRALVFQSQQIDRLNKRVEELEKPIQFVMPYHLKHETNYKIPHWWSEG